MKSATAEMPIFTRTFDFLTWLLPVTNRFPRAQRFTVTKRLLDAAFDLREYLEAAQRRRGRDRLRALRRRYAAGEITLETVTASVQGWVNHVRYGNTVGLRKAVLDSLEIPRRK